MKFSIPSILLIGALTHGSPASLVAQSADEQDSVATERARVQEKRQVEDAKRQAENARRQAEQAKQQAEIGKQQAEFAKEQAEEVKAQVEIALRQVAELKNKFSSDEQRELAEEAMKSARQVMEKVQQSLGNRLYAQGPKPPIPAQPARPPTAPEPPETPKAAKAWGFSHDGFPFSSRRPSVRTLVVSPDTSDAKALANIEEDLSVMWRILDKETERELGKDSGDHAMGISISSGDSRNPNAVQLDGFGALFTLSVRFPLVAPPKAKEEKKSDPASDTTWEKTRRELFGSPDGGKPVKSKFRGDRKPEVEYDAAKVETLKNTLLEALKNASNLRNVKPDEYVSVAVLGGGSGGDMFVYDFNNNSNLNRSSFTVTTSGSASSTATASAGGGLGKIITDEIMVKADGGRNSTLTIRVKKSDVDTFAKGSLSAEEFRNKAAINIY